MLRMATFREFIRRDSTLSRLAVEARALLALDEAWQALLPGALAGRCQAVRIRDDELLLYAESGMVAARLRLVTPGLLPALAGKGYPATRFRIRVALIHPPPPPGKAIMISPAALDKIEAATETAVRHPLVRDALVRLIRHHRNR